MNYFIVLLVVIVLLQYSYIYYKIYQSKSLYNTTIDNIKLYRPLSAPYDRNKHHIQIKQIKAFDQNNKQINLICDTTFGKNCQSSYHLTDSNGYGPSSGKLAIDNNMNSMTSTNWGSPYEYHSEDHWLSYKILGGGKIGKVIIYNRDNCESTQTEAQCWDRIVGTKLQFYNNANLIAEYTIPVANSVYELNVI